MSIEISATSMIEALNTVLMSKLTPMLIGSPGIGKSDIVKSVAKMHNLKLIDMRLALSDPTDLNGFPTLQQDGTRMGMSSVVHSPYAYHLAVTVFLRYSKMVRVWTMHHR